MLNTLIQRPLALRRKASSATLRVLRALFYTLAFGRRLPGVERLTRFVAEWEAREGFAERALARDVWETEYRDGRWNFLARLDQLSHYSVLVGYVEYLHPQGAILDVGCGQGLLFDRLRPYGDRRYLGLDVSEAALAPLRSCEDDRTRFLRTDAETYVPTDRYDVIVFNESLYYFGDPLAVVARYVGALNPGGVLMVSVYERPRRARAILSRLHATYRLLDETRVTQGGRSWRCSVFSPR
jgi:2-polyprenyl-3-methyl-5-hydroxy-6-metoxy-1,4-benzoquinol methylase